MVKKSIYFSISFLFGFAILFLFVHSKFSKPALAFTVQFVQTSCNTDADCPSIVNDQTVICKPGWINGQSHKTCQLDSGPGSCPGGFLCGTSGACTNNCAGAKCDGPAFGDTYACVFCDTIANPLADCSVCTNGTQLCKMTKYSAVGSCTQSSKYVSCTPPTATPTNSPVPTANPCAPLTDKGLGCTCTGSTVCASGYCGETTNGSTCQKAPVPTPTTAPCGTGGYRTIAYTQGLGCGPSQASSITVTCNDNIQFTKSAGYCPLLSQWTATAQSLCASHTTCPTPTPTNTPTPTPSPTSSPTPTNSPTPTITPLSCDANHDGTTDDKDLPILQNEWYGGASTKNADCNHDGVVNGLDFQIWRNVWILKMTHY